MRRSKYTREVLEPVVVKVHSLAEVIRALGVKPTGGTHRYFKARIARAGLDTSHFGARSRQVIESVSLHELSALVTGATSYAGILKQLGLPTVGRPLHELKRRIAALAIEVSHFRGQPWNRGETRMTHPSLERAASRISLSDAEVFCSNSVVKGSALEQRLLRKGWRYQCSVCAIAEWRGLPLTLHIDHINGEHYDNRLENLRFLCPNCHSQTPTYCNRAREACYTFAASRAWWNW